MSDVDGTYTYSRIVPVAGDKSFVPIFPNPATTVVTFQVSNALLNTTAILHHISGRIVQHVVITETRQPINIKALPTGIYILKFVDGTTQRFVKE